MTTSRKNGPVSSKANERQVGGDHYKNPGGIEHWDLVVAWDLDYFQAQITKYVARWKKKGGVEDLKKAAHFLEKYIEVADHLESRIFVPRFRKRRYQPKGTT